MTLSETVSTKSKWVMGNGGTLVDDGRDLRGYERHYFFKNMTFLKIKQGRG
jgi:hypothetical protein